MALKDLQALIEFHQDVHIGDTVIIEYGRHVGEKAVVGEVYSLVPGIVKLAKLPRGIFNLPEWKWQRYEVQISEIASYDVLQTAAEKYLSKGPVDLTAYYDELDRKMAGKICKSG